MFDAPGVGGAVFRGFRAVEGAGFDWARACLDRVWERRRASSTHRAVSFLNFRNCATSSRTTSTSSSRTYSVRLFIWCVWLRDCQKISVAYCCRKL